MKPKKSVIDPYRADAGTCLRHARLLNAWLDDLTPPGVTANTVLVMALAIRVAEAAGNETALMAATSKTASSLMAAVRDVYSAKVG